MHHRAYRLIRGHQEDVAWWNLAFLFTIALFPFSAALLGRFSANPVAVMEFALNLLLASLTTTLTVWLADRRGLLVTSAGPDVVRSIQWRGFASMTVALVSIPVAVVDPAAAQLVWLLLAFAPRWTERRSARSAG